MVAVLVTAFVKVAVVIIARAYSEFSCGGGHGGGCGGCGGGRNGCGGDGSGGDCGGCSYGGGCGGGQEKSNIH